MSQILKCNRVFQIFNFPATDAKFSSWINLCVRVCMRVCVREGERAREGNRFGCGGKHKVDVPVSEFQ